MTGIRPAYFEFAAMFVASDGRHSLPAEGIIATLPGPTRRRTPSPYRFRLTYRSPDPAGEGCALLWDVDGGRLTYQIALERRADGDLCWHCTCADAVYRGEDSPDHRCKHVRGLLRIGRAEPPEAALDATERTP